MALPGSSVAVEAATDLPASAHLVLVGGCGALGDWSPDEGLVMDAIPRPGGGLVVFAASVAASDLPEHFECKLAWRSGSGSWVWEEGPNRAVATLALPTHSGRPRLFASWRPYLLSEDRAAVEAGRLGREPAKTKVPFLGVIDGDTHGDPWLEPQRAAVAARAGRIARSLSELDEASDAERLGPVGLDGGSRGFETMGLTRGSKGGVPGWWFRDWAPGAVAASLVGDFNGWDTSSTRCERDGRGVWSAFVPDRPDGGPAIEHGSRYKVSLVVPGDAPSGGGEPVSGEEAIALGLAVSPPPRRVWRLPPWARYCLMDASNSHLEAVHWAPPEAERHVWRHGRLRWSRELAWPGEAEAPGLAVVGPVASAPKRASASASASASAPASASGPSDGHAASGLRVYECHAGLAGDEPRVHTYAELAAKVLPRVAALGYNAVQLMGAVEHAYYASFGYLVNGFFAPAGRSGTPEEFKACVDAAHDLGLAVIIDLVHSHASPNTLDGLNGYDGTDHCYFHEGGRGRHEGWGSRLFNYGHPEVRRFLLSNLRWWLEEYRVDGFRFDGVTSMLYLHHGLGVGFSGSYDEYFGPTVDEEAVAYLGLANALCHCVDPPALTIAEDVSGMPTLCRPLADGGVGFDCRLAMAVPDEWIKLVKDTKDEDWGMGRLVHVLTNRRWQEKAIAYAESHDQALVGDKTLAFHLMDAAMYTDMTALRPAPPVIERGIALHKVIRLLTHALGGEGWLTFMGNEFGHPEWLDFPREGNGWSFHYARRQFALADDETLRYRHLAAFDGALQAAERDGPCQWLRPGTATFVSRKHEGDKVIVFERGEGASCVLVAVNLHPSESFVDYQVGAPRAGQWAIFLSSDDGGFGGHDRIDASVRHVASPEEHGFDGRPASLRLYLPSRTAVVLGLSA